jgi:anthranilate phosphoribosyltransferase
VVLANAAAALVTAQDDLSFVDAVAKAEEVLMSGKALQVFNTLVNPKTTISFA